jgi:tRNA dimethylallyltransferase
MPTLPPLIAIVGPTAVGKTALSLALAQRLHGGIVSADSRQVYRQMDIGTAKPTPAEQAAAPHFLLDVVAPDEPFSLATYQEQAMAALAALTAQGRVPLLVGGTGQYLAAVLEGWQIPRVPPQPELRAELEETARTQGVGALYAWLAEVDPQAAATIDRDNLRRIIRALEVYSVTGQPISVQQTRQTPPYQITTLWLDMPRAALYARIDRRVDAMLAAGLLAEVEQLLARGYRWDSPAMSGLGYRQFQPYVAGQATLEACVERLKFDTHAFARRQANWFRRLPGLVRVQLAGE